MNDITLLGDPHLGRMFKNGVPLHRRGEREATQWTDLYASLITGAKLHVNMGDLFDTDDVPYSTILRASVIYKSAAAENPDTTYVVIRGNHDDSRIVEHITAYDVFAALMKETPNVYVLGDDPLEIEDRLFVPWHPIKPASEMIPRTGHFEAVYGHWDVRDFGAESPNMVPTKELMNVTAAAFTGHEHKAATISGPAFDLVLTGSMQPYAHGEEANRDLYLSLTLKELQGFQGSLHDKSVRLLLAPGESAPELDVLQLTVKRISEQDDGDAPQVQVEDFDLRALYDEACTEAEVGEPMKQKTWTYFEGEKT